MNQSKDQYIFDEDLGREAYSFTLGLKEFLFLSLIFFFGFCGFSVCIDKIYAQKPDKSIKDITIHEIEISTLNDGTETEFLDCLVVY
ncbi:MAG: hypothetical protein HKO89_07285 [Saprospiraceae bacterium]|nr:hypothetical protein [Bacteroidia bacterium]NNK90396.1 hypothetical protein [Saprospiraceae bacterium]